MALEAPKSEKRVLAPGQVIGNYTVKACIGLGGMAEVYSVEHSGLGKLMAMKVLRPEFAAQEELRARFLQEGKAASRIRHPHVVEMVDVGESGEIVYLVMELLEGETLEELFDRRGVLSIERALDVLLPVVAALGAAHDRGVVHRDLKPGNIFLAKDGAGRVVPKVLDFGVSRLSDSSGPRITVTSSVLGTPHYMSPEQARGDRELDGRSDQFSLGIILYETLVGRLPYTTEHIVGLIHEVAKGEIPLPSKFGAQLPEAFQAVLMKSLAAKPDDRWKTMHEFGRTLLAFASQRTKEKWGDFFERRNPESLPPPSVPLAASAEVSIPRIELNGTPGPNTLANAAGQAAAQGNEPNRTPLIAGAVVLLLLLGGGAAYMLGRSAGAETSSGSSTASGAESAGAGGSGGIGSTPTATGPTTPPPAVPLPTEAPTVAPAPVEPTPVEPAVAAAEDVRVIELDLLTPGAVVSLDGAPVGGSPHATLRIPLDEVDHVVTIAAPGFTTRVFHPGREAMPLRVDLPVARRVQPRRDPTPLIGDPPPASTPRPRDDDDDLRGAR